MNINLNKTIYVKDVMLGRIMEIQLVESLSDTQTLCKLNDKFIIVNNSDILDDDKLIIAKKLINSEKLYKKYLEKYEKLYWDIDKLKNELFK